MAKQPDSRHRRFAASITLSFTDDDRDYPDRQPLRSVRLALKQDRDEGRLGDHDEAQNSVNDGGPTYNRMPLD